MMLGETKIHFLSDKRALYNKVEDNLPISTNGREMKRNGVNDRKEKEILDN